MKRACGGFVLLSALFLANGCAHPVRKASNETRARDFARDKQARAFKGEIQNLQARIRELESELKENRGNKTSVPPGRFNPLLPPVPPPNVGYMYKPPEGWHEGGRGATFINPSENLNRDLHIRLWIDGLEVVNVAHGNIIIAPIKTEIGMASAPLLPPGEEIFVVLDAGSHSIRAELFEGPAPYQKIGIYQDRLDFNRCCDKGRLTLRTWRFVRIP